MFLEEEGTSGMGEFYPSEAFFTETQHTESLESDKDDDDELLGKVIAEFDGTTVLCRVCGDKASGFHYGVHSCEGCKGFFRRSIQQKIQYRPCTKNQQCSILRINRNRCQYCRLKKCISVGMSRDAVRFGRVPKREKAKILAAMQSSAQNRHQEQALSVVLDDESALINTVIHSHLETCDYTREKVAPMIQRAREQPDYATITPALACPLNPTPQPVNGQAALHDFSERFSPAIRGVVEFAKRLPGFTLLPQDDQVTLLKAGVFEVLLVRLANMFDAQTNTMLCLNGQVLKREAVHNSAHARFLMDSMFEFAERLNTLCLSEPELALFCGVVIVSSDRPGLRNTELVDRIAQKLTAALQKVVMQRTPDNPLKFQELLRKIPDLRTLNTLHSEKLLAFKMTEQQQAAQEASRSPGSDPYSSPRSSETGYDSVKSPAGSLSSGESVCSGEIAVISDLRAGQTCPLKRRRDNSETGHSSGEDEGCVINESPSKYKRKVDSPHDSGFESGTEKLDKLSSTNTSVCSSPHSALEEHQDDMPVLKRALQAPPLINTNLLMDEAYKPHKKFRALRKEDEVNSTASPPRTETVQSGHSTLAKSLMGAPKFSSEHQKQSELIHSMIMRGEPSRPFYIPPNPNWPSALQQRLIQPPSRSFYSNFSASSTATSSSVTESTQPLNLSKKISLQT